MNNAPENSYPQPFEAFLVIFIGVVLSFLPQYLVYTSIADPNATELDPRAIKLTLIIGELALLALPVIYLKRRQISLREAFRLNPVHSSTLTITLLVGLCLVIVVDEIDRLIRLAFPMPDEITVEINRMLQINDGLDFVLIVLSAVVLAAVVEEFIFRGFLQQSIERHIDVTKAVIYASIAWAAVHGSLYVAIQLFVFGFFLGWLAWRTDSVYPAIVCHALNNAIAIWYGNTDHSQPIPVYEWNGHVSPIILILAIGVGYVGIQQIEDGYRKPSSPS